MTTTHRVLVPFELPDADPVPPVLVETLAAIEVVALGHYGLPEQTPPSAGRDQFEADATAELDALATPFESAGVPVTTRLVFGKARHKTIDRVAVEERCDVILTPGRADAVGSLFVPLRGEEILADATDRLVEMGVAPDRISRRLSEDDDVGRSIVEIGEDFDVLVLGETEPSLRNRILGTVPAQVTADTEDPVFVVRATEADEP